MFHYSLHNYLLNPILRGGLKMSSEFTLEFFFWMDSLILVYLAGQPLFRPSFINGAFNI